MSFLSRLPFTHFQTGLSLQFTFKSVWKEIHTDKFPVQTLYFIYFQKLLYKTYFTDLSINDKYSKGS